MKAITDLINELNAQIDSRSMVVTSGNCVDIAQYKMLTGEIRGLSSAKQLLTDLVRKLENDEDD